MGFEMLWRATGDARYLGFIKREIDPYCFDEATRQIALFAKHARKGDTGLYYHAWAAKPELALVVPARKFAWADAKTGLSSEVWSEGLGWYALVVVETLAALPSDHPRRADVLDIYTRLAAGLKRTQNAKTGGRAIAALLLPGCEFSRFCRPRISPTRSFRTWDAG
jgi:rhamnogalacturonyl hydrolase YesR